MEDFPGQPALEALLTTARAQNISDIHLTSGAPMMTRRFCRFQQAGPQELSHDQLTRIIKRGVPPEFLKQAMEVGDVEYVHEIPGSGRYRVTIMRHRMGWSLTARIIDSRIRTMDAAGMPSACAGLTRWAQGLVIVTGPSGSGKTSTLASMVEMINQTRADHVITIEKPIEVIFKSRKCQISQREVGYHTASTQDALRAALREDPDVIVVNELRDLETFRLAVTASETGHLVFATMNSRDSAQALTTLIGSFPSDEQPLIRDMVAQSLRGVISQVLIPRMDGSGAVPAYEVMLINSAVANLIRYNRTRQLGNVIGMGKAEGMLLLEHSTQELVDRKIISAADAQLFSPPMSMFSMGFLTRGAGA
ncbi:MAG: PilT/PilU family type 4a pilus ATPase [Candidatus Omnitrophica bacterium]|nr:PilT/PilU family type 4a pilus ATPase [Candidatus Omnitrophota bacterium]